jgi:hypothetical protein
MDTAPLCACWHSLCVTVKVRLADFFVRPTLQATYPSSDGGYVFASVRGIVSDTAVIGEHFVSVY